MLIWPVQAALLLSGLPTPIGSRINSFCEKIALVQVSGKILVPLFPLTHLGCETRSQNPC